MALIRMRSDAAKPCPCMRDVNGMRQMGDLVDRNLDRQDHLSARRLSGFQHLGAEPRAYQT